QRDTAVPGAEEAAERRLPGVPRLDPSAVPRMAGVAGIGRGQLPYGRGLATRRAKLGNPTGLAAGPMSRTEPDGSPVAPWQGADLCQPAVRVDRGTRASLPPLSGGIVRGRDAAESGRIIRGLLVEVGIKDGHFMGLSANRRAIDKKGPEKRVRSKIIAPPTRLTTSSESDRSPQLAENKGF